MSVQIAVDDRVRLTAAVLAATEWPQRAQAVLAHAVHPHAKQTGQQVQSLQSHAAAMQVNTLLDRVPLASFFTAVLCCKWPSLRPQQPLPAQFAAVDWLPAVADFYAAGELASFWQSHAAIWDEAAQALQQQFAHSGLPQFLSKLMAQPLQKQLTIVPNLVYPALQTLVCETAAHVFVIVPPPKAVGESPPWPYDEDPGWVLAQVSRHLIETLLADSWAQMDSTQATLLQHAAVTLCLEQLLDETEAMAYQFRTKKEQKLPQLPQTVATLREWLAAANGRSLQSLTVD